MNMITLPLVKRAFFHISKWLGLFNLARRLTGSGLRILCYHGFSLRDEHAFRPQVFITSPTFYRRMAFLAKHRFPVLPLDDALDRLEQGSLPLGATVVTIDDGFYSTYQCGRHALQKFSFAATLYLTTYHCVKETPVFRLAVQYMFWKGARSRLQTQGPLKARGDITLGRGDAREAEMWSIIRHGETQCDESQRYAIAKGLGERLGGDYDALAEERLLSLVNRAEIREMALSGIDIQLHGHRHRPAVDEATATREIDDNRAVLEPLVCRPLQHFCYPSGVWSKRHAPWLRAAGIKSAVTCEQGLNYRGTSRYELKRFLDGENISQIEFEAELYGYAELLRRARSRGAKLLRRSRAKEGDEACESYQSTN